MVVPIIRAQPTGTECAGTFSKDAWDFVEHIDKKIVLIDGEQLAQLMIDHGIGVATART